MNTTDAAAAIRNLDALPELRRRHLVALAADARTDADRARLVFLAQDENRRVRRQIEAALTAEFSARARWAEGNPERPAEAPQTPTGGRRWAEEGTTHDGPRPVTVAWGPITKTATEKQTRERKPLMGKHKKYAELLADARRAFLADTSYAVTIAEASAGINIRKENRDDPEQLRQNILRLHAQGAGLDEIQRVQHASRTLITEVTRDAPESPQDAPAAREIDPRDRMPPPRPVIPSKKLKKWTPKPLSAVDERHGTNAGYMHGCRCEPCVKARMAYRVERRANPPKPRATNSEHGTNSRYTKGCRCDDCRAAATAWARDYRERKSRREN